MALTLNNNLNSLKVGDYFWCKYTVTTANTVGVFSDIATKTDAEATPIIPVASSNLPNGYFRFIMVEDWNGKKRLIADRNIQHSISWDVLNTSGIASGSGLPMLFTGYNPKNYQFSMRLLTGGISSTDKDNEWDKYIVNSTLDGTITAGDNNVWNWNGRYTLSSTAQGGSASRIIKGSTLTGASALSSNNVNGEYTGFRPMLEIESLVIGKSFISLSDGYKKLDKGSPELVLNGLTPKMTSNTSPSPFVVSASSEYIGFPAWLAFNHDNKTNFQDSWLSAIDTGWLQVKLNVPIDVNSYRVTLSISSSITIAPKNWTFEGSNDAVVWTVLDTRINETGWAIGESRLFNITNVNTYLYYRINITANNGSGYVGIGEVNLYSLNSPSIIPATLPSFKTVSPTLPTLDQFQTDGMGDLSILDRKVQNVLGGSTEMTNEILGEGKVFKASIDLKKYFDIQKIEVK